MSSVSPTSEELDAVLRKLRLYKALGQPEAEAVGAALGRRVQRLGPREDLIREGDLPEYIHVVLSGWGCRYKMLEDGRRQILAFLLPGDFCDATSYLLPQMDHSVASLTEMVYTSLLPSEYERLLRQHSGFAHAMTVDALVTAAIQREWIVNLGQRDSFERVAHLFCEIFVRLQAIGQTRDHSGPFPVTQLDLAEATGISAVHVNRPIQSLRSAGLVVLSAKTLKIPDLESLQAAGLFSPGYLHHSVAHP